MWLVDGTLIDDKLVASMTLLFKFLVVHYLMQCNFSTSSRVFQDIMESRGPRRINDADRIFSYSSITSPLYRNAPATGVVGPSNANNESDTDEGKIM